MARVLWPGGANATMSALCDAVPEAPSAGAGGAMETVRSRFRLEGTVQGVGFRPFAARLALRYGLSGEVLNTPGGVLLEVEGERSHVEQFALCLRNEAPALVRYHRFETREIPLRGGAGFRIEESRTEGSPTGWVLPDLGTCAACESEFRDPAGRRARYPFLSCTECGPRYSIVESLPYDRSRTTMERFPLCGDCLREYGDVGDRRFHAETTACPACGPKAWYEGRGGDFRGLEAFRAASETVRGGGILAALGLGGFLLLCDARDGEAVRELRRRKRREARPFAVMFPAPPGDPLAILRRYAEWGGFPAERFLDPVRPIVILPLKEGTDLHPEVGGGFPWVGAYLPTTAFHAELLDRVGGPCVCTSGNPTGDPIITSPEEGRERLKDIADGVLLHDRPILRGVDDSVVRHAQGEPIVIRRARGMAPLPLPSPFPCGGILGVGGHLKVALAVGLGDRVAVGPHIGDLEGAASVRSFRRQAEEFPRLLGAAPVRVACDMHPAYASTRWARRRGLPVVEVQHHHAHIAAVMAEARIAPEQEVLGLALDGTGWGTDGRVWGGELLRCSYGRFRRIAALLPFPLLGGERAILDPWRIALAMILKAFPGEPLPHVTNKYFKSNDLLNMNKMFRHGDSLECTSGGRLFDGFAALILRDVRNRFEGEAPMRLEAACGGPPAEFPRAPIIRNGAPRDGEPTRWIDWRPWVRFCIEEGNPEMVSRLATGFHEALAEVLTEAVALSREEEGELPVAAGGGCFQNARLAAAIRCRIPSLLMPVDLPPNDGGLSYGQVIVAAARAEGSGVIR